MLKSIFTPYVPLTKSGNLVATLFWIGVLFLCWTLSTKSALPTPNEVLEGFVFQVTERQLIVELWHSVQLNIVALTFGAIISLLLCYTMPIGLMRPLVDMTSLVRLLGLAGLAFTFAVLVHDLNTRKVVIMLFCIVPWMVTGMSQVIRSIGDDEYDHARSLKLGHLGTTWEVVVRGHLHEAIDIVRQNLGISWMMVATVEGLAQSGGGIGISLLKASKVFALDQIFAIIFVILIVGQLQGLALQLARRWACPYATLNQRSM